MITLFASEEARARLPSFLTCCPKRRSFCNVSNWAIKVKSRKKARPKSFSSEHVNSLPSFTHTQSKGNQISPRQQQPHVGKWDFFVPLISLFHSLSLSSPTYLDTCPQWHRRHGRTHVWPIIFLQFVRKACRWATREWKHCWKCQEVD